MAKPKIVQVPGNEKQVDKAWKLEQEVETLKGQLKAAEDALKELGRGHVSGFGSIELLGHEAIAQIQFRRPSISLKSNEAVETAKELLGDKFPLFFNVSTSGAKVLVQSQVEKLEALIVKAGKKVSDFLQVETTATANDAWLEPKLRTAILGAETEKIAGEVSRVTSVRNSGEAIKWEPRKE